MNKLIYAFLIGSALSNTAPAFAENRADPANRAVNVSLGSNGGAIDNAALRSIRKLVGKAITADTVDTFAVYSPRAGGPILIEGGLSACAEAAFRCNTRTV